MTQIVIHAMPNVRQDDPVRVRVTVSPSHASPINAAVSPHGEKSQTLDLRALSKGEYEGTFRPDRPGRWWVEVAHTDASTEACLWVRARNVPPVAS